eukprot:3775440-Lingulodinium_polyedra.AAC.1
MASVSGQPKQVCGRRLFAHWRVQGHCGWELCWQPGEAPVYYKIIGHVACTGGPRVLGRAGGRLRWLRVSRAQLVLRLRPPPLPA